MEDLNQKPKLFHAQNQEILKSKLPIILCTVFSKSGEASVQKKRQLKLYNTYISSIKQGSSKIKTLVLSFELSFQILRKAPSSQKKEQDLQFGRPIGIRLRNDRYKIVQFYHQNPQEIQKWEIQLGKRINQRGFHQLFKAMKKLGKGNFATVYLGERLKDKKNFAIKAFAKQATFSQQNGKQALINQIKINRMFDHPNLMKIQGVFESQNSIYIILQLVEGTQLYTKLIVKHKFAENQIKIIMKGLLQGIAEMARKNVIHRDLKPQNIMFRKDGKQVVIVDFGLSTIADQKNYLFVRCGTPGYVAPEIINIKDMTQKSQPIADVFSLGAIFYALLFNKSLFPGKNFNQVLTQNRECEFVLSGGEFDNIPHATADLLRKMLQKQPQLRITAAQALRHPYFGQAPKKKAYIPKLLFKASGSCPIYLIDKKNESNIKFIIKQQKSLLNKITQLDIQNLNNIKNLNVEKLLTTLESNSS